MPTRAQQKVSDALVAVYKEWAGWGFGDPNINKLANANRFAFIVGVILDGGGVTAAQAWRGMLNFRTRLKREGIDFTAEAVAGTHLATLRRLAAEKPAIHRFHPHVARQIKEAAKQIVEHYGGDADEVLNTYTARECFFRLLDFEGIGDKKANMAVRLLVDEMGYEYEDVDNMRVPVDRHVERVFRRTGLVPADAGRAEIQKMATALHPEAPWALDSAFHIGFTWCTEKKPWCNGDPAAEGEDRYEPCPLKACCPSRK